MFIEIKSSETSRVKKLASSGIITEGDFVRISSKSGFKDYSIEDKKLKLSFDSIDNERDFTAEEEKKFFNKNGKEQALDFFLNKNSDDHPYRIYSAFSDIWDESFEYIRHDGYWEQSMQTAFSITLNRNTNLNEFLKEFNLIIDRIIPIDLYNMKNVKVLYIFEHTLSKNGIYNLIIGDKYCLGMTVYGREKIINSFDTLEEALDYIKNNHYYE